MSVFLLDPEDPDGTEKPGEVIKGSGGQKSPSGVQWQSPWWGLGAKSRNGGLGQSPQKLNRF